MEASEFFYMDKPLQGSNSLLSSAFILIVPLQEPGRSYQPGGQVTAANGIKEYAESRGFQLSCINTIQSSFPPPGLMKKIMQGIYRIICLIQVVSRYKYKGAILFAGPNILSVTERLFEAFLCHLRGIPVLLFYRGGPEFLNNALLNNVIVKKLFQIPSFWGAQSTAAVNTLYRFNLSDERVLHIRNWLPVSYKIRSEPLSYNGEFVSFIFVGWVIKEKGIEELLRAVVELKPKFKFQVKIVGGGSSLEWAEKFIDEFEIGDVVKLLGWQPAEVVRNELLASHVFVLPSYSEGFPNALLEAMACGLPSIATSVGGIADTLKTGVNGILIHSGNVEELRDAMEQYLETPLLIENHSRGALGSVAELHSYSLNVEKCFNSFLDLKKV